MFNELFAYIVFASVGICCNTPQCGNQGVSSLLRTVAHEVANGLSYK